MKKQMNRSRLHRWTSFLLVFMLVSGMFASPIKVYANPYTGGNSNCTHTAWRLAYEHTGVQLPAWSNAGTWYDSARNAGYTVSTVPRAKSIAVWRNDKGGGGHVAYVTEVKGDQIYIQEGGYEGGYHEGWENAYGQTKYYGLNNLTMIGYIYLGDTSPTINETVDLGSSFYAFLTNALSNLDATVIDDNITLKTEVGTGNQVFLFTKQSNGYYAITDCTARKLSLDVTNGSTESRANVGAYEWWGGTNQQWKIIGGYDNKYTLIPGCSSCVLSAAYGGYKDGANVNVETDTQQDWQKWYIRKLPGVGKTTVNAQVGQGKVTLTWTQASECNSYSLRIYKNGKDFHSEYGLKVLSKTVELEAGTYTAYIDSCNAYSFLKSNDVSFTIAETADNTEKEHKLVTIPMTNATCTQSGWTQGEYCSVCGEVFAEQKEIPPTGHQGGTATCIAAAACDICHEEYGDINPKKHENVQTQGARVKTCAADGYTGDVICCDCYEVIEQGTVIPADGHAWSDWRTIRQTDCVNAGKRQRTCENCDETETKEISPTGHQGGTATCIAAAVCDICHEEYGDINPKNHESVQTQGTRVKTCATDGYTGDVICCDCNEVIKRGTVIPADGHAWSAWRTIQQADCVNTGKRQRTCENCDETESKKITALGHDIVTDKAVPATTSSTGLTKGSHCGVCGEILEAQKIVPKLEKVTKPKAPTVKLTTKKKTVQIKISKVSEASGYEIYRSKSKSSGYKKITSTKKISYTNKGLTAKKTYYYKVRAYKTANGKKVYGNWSKVMKIKVKK